MACTCNHRWPSDGPETGNEMKTDDGPGTGQETWAKTEEWGWEGYRVWGWWMVGTDPSNNLELKQVQQITKQE